MKKLLPTLVLLVMGSLAHAQSPTFAPAVTYATGTSYVYSLAVADLNGDTKPDVVTVNGGSDKVGVFLGTASGSLQPVVTYATGLNSGPSDVQIVDVNRDGIVDLLTANSSTSTLGVLLGNGNGTFQAVTTYPSQVSSNPVGLAVADLNGDGNPDVALLNWLNPFASVLLGNGNGTFQAAVHYSIPTGGRRGDASDIAIGDVNGDGLPDLLTTHFHTSTLGVLLGNGNGTFQAATVLIGASSLPSAVVLADVNGDSRLDVLLANSGNATVGVGLAPSTGALSAITTYPAATGSSPQGLAVADITNDGRPDLLVTTNATGSAFALVAGNGNGTFQAPISYPAAPVAGYSRSIAVADLNGDGKSDVLVTNTVTNTLSVFLNTTVLATRNTLAATVNLWPNPAGKGATTLSLAGLPPAVKRVQVAVLDATGRMVAHHLLPAAQGTAQANLPTNGLAAGLYLVLLSTVDAQGIVFGTLPVQRLSLQ
jgi:hypothetical protein